jgi:hypothetical protein
MRVQGIITAVAASLALSACYTSRVITTPNITAQAPREIRVTRVDGSETTVFMPVLQGQTIVGRSNGRECLLESCRVPDVNVPVGEVKEVKVKTMDKTKTYALVGLGVAGIFAATFALKGNGPDMGCVGNCMTSTARAGAGASIPAAALRSALSRVTHSLATAISR